MTIPAAIETFKLSARPGIFIFSKLFTSSNISSATPEPSLPKIIATRPVILSNSSKYLSALSDVA